jgi:hypothetical protein
MSDNEQKETVRGYEIQRSIVFENNRGFALGENPEAVSPFVTWQFTEENGAREYYWGHYTANRDTAARDYELRVAEYQKDYGLSEKNAYKYYSTQRPVDIGTFPKTVSGPIRFVNFDTRESVEMGRIQAWGYLIYDAPLTEKQISDYKLRAAPDNPDVKARLHEQAQTVGAWEEKRKFPDIQRLTWWYSDFGSFVPKEFVTPEQMDERYDFAADALTRTNGGRPSRIADQLAEAGKQAERDNAARSAPAKDKGKDKPER